MKNNLLNQIKIVTPCRVNWDEMKGTEECRFCDQCQFHVHNISLMSEAQTFELFSKSSGRTCVRIEHAPQTPLSFSDGLFRRLHTFTGYLRVVVAALIGFIALPSVTDAQTAKPGFQHQSRQSISQSA